jgi:hypothetical protein
MAGSHSIGLLGGQIGRAGTSRGIEGDDDEVRKWHSDVARLCGSYQYNKYGLTPPPTFNKREAKSNRGLVASSLSASTSRVRYPA